MIDKTNCIQKLQAGLILKMEEGDRAINVQPQVETENKKELEPLLASVKMAAAKGHSDEIELHQIPGYEMTNEMKAKEIGTGHFSNVPRYQELAKMTEAETEFIQTPGSSKMDNDANEVEEIIVHSECVEQLKSLTKEESPGESPLQKQTSAIGIAEPPKRLKLKEIKKVKEVREYRAILGCYTNL